MTNADAIFFYVALNVGVAVAVIAAVVLIGAAIG
jgi:hypothetical protein